MSKRRSFLVLFSIFFGLESNAQFFNDANKSTENLFGSFSLHKPFYTVIIDAGSTETRVFVYTFRISNSNQQLILDDELFYRIKPGLSSFVDYPKNIEKSLKILLLKAKSKIPQTEWSHTPLTMKATAGLRLLPGDQASNIIQECKRVLNSSGFKVSDDSVSIMDGSDEGIFSWFSANFLLDRFSSENKNNFLAAFDLGGGSTQVTFVVNTDSSSEKSVIDEKNVYNIKAFDQNMSVFTKSYLGMGLNAARKEILTHSDNYENFKIVPHSEEFYSDSVKLHSICVSPILSDVKWIYGGKKYLINGVTSGSDEEESGYSSESDEDGPPCIEIIRKVVKKTIPKRPQIPANTEILGFAYYFERAVEARLIDPVLGGRVTVESFYEASLVSWKYPIKDHPLMSLDLSFIYVLLHEGFGLDNKTGIIVRRKINDHEINWALGAAFNVTKNLVIY